MFVFCGGRPILDLNIDVGGSIVGARDAAGDALGEGVGGLSDGLVGATDLARPCDDGGTSANGIEDQVALVGRT